MHGGCSLSAQWLGCWATLLWPDSVPGWWTEILEKKKETYHFHGRTPGDSVTLFSSYRISPGTWVVTLREPGLATIETSDRELLALVGRVC